MASPASHSASRLVGARWAVEGSGRVFNFALSVIGARWLGPASWGLYWTAFCLAQTLTLLTDLGGHQNLARRTAESPRRGPEFLAPALHLKHLLAFGVIGVWVVAAPWVPNLPPTLTWLLLIALLCLSYAEFLGYYLRGLGRVIGEAALLGGDAVLGCVFGLGALVAGAGLTGLAASQIAAHAIALAAAWAWIKSSTPPAVRHRRPGAVAAHFTDSVPLAVALLAMTGSFRLGLFFLQWSGLGNTPEAGFYAVVHRLVDSIRFFPYVAGIALFPSFARGPRSRNPWQALAWLIPASIVVTFAVTRPAVMGWFTLKLLGPAYAPAAPLLALMLWTIPAMTLSSMFTNWLIVRGHTVTAAGVALAHMATHTAGLFLLVPTRGPGGAAAALVAAEFVAAVATLFAWFRFRHHR